MHRVTHDPLKVRRLLAVLLLALLASPASRAGAPDDAARALFNQNQRSDGSSIFATVGPRDGARVGAASLACVNCHGAFARGRREGGTTAPAIDGYTLTKPWGSTSDSGRQREAYDAERFHRAISSGIDASGNRLDPAMPRFEVSPEESRRLFEWLKAAASPAVAGVEDHTVTIGYPTQGMHPEAVREAQARIAEANAAGGIFGRVLRLSPMRPGLEVVAIICPSPGQVDLQWPAARTPTVLIGCARDSATGAADRSFRILTTPEERMELLVDYARRELGISPARVHRQGQPSSPDFPLAFVWNRQDSELLSALERIPTDAPAPVILIAEGESVSDAAKFQQSLPARHRSRLFAAFPLPPSAPSESGRPSASHWGRLGRASASIVIEALRLAGLEPFELA